jgi:hypothetical protein
LGAEVSFVNLPDMDTPPEVELKAELCSLAFFKFLKLSLVVGSPEVEENLEEKLGLISSKSVDFLAD